MPGLENFPKIIELNENVRTKILEAFLEFSQIDLDELSVQSIELIDALEEESKLNILKQLFETFCSSEKGIETLASLGIDPIDVFAIVFPKLAEKLGQIELGREE